MAKNRRRGKRHMDPQMSALAEIEKEGLRQKKMLYSAIAIVLWDDCGEKEPAIRKFFEVNEEVRQECAGDNMKSMLQICEEETGIEIQNGNGKSWHDMIFLNAELDTGKMTKAKYISMRRQQVKWVAPLTAAVILVTLHRRYGFDDDKCEQAYMQILAVMEKYGNDPAGLCRACMDITGIDIGEVINNEGKQTADRSDGDNKEQERDGS